MHEGKVRTWDYNRAERASERRRGIRLTDARRMAVYLAKYGIAGRKDHQHHIPRLACLSRSAKGPHQCAKALPCRGSRRRAQRRSNKVFDLIRSRKLASVKVGGSRRVTEQAIDDYIARLCHESEVA
jgi:hypothetical protein